MKQLDATVFQAVDLDVPKDTLHLSVLKVPQHGRIVRNGLEQVATGRSIVMDFTMTDITNGTSSSIPDCWLVRARRKNVQSSSVSSYKQMPVLFSVEVQSVGSEPHAS